MNRRGKSICLRPGRRISKSSADREASSRLRVCSEGILGFRWVGESELSVLASREARATIRTYADGTGDKTDLGTEPYRKSSDFNSLGFSRGFVVCKLKSSIG